jgi:hypothetical protein
MKPNQLEPRGISEHSALQPNHATKVFKSREAHPYEAPKIDPIVEDAPQELESQALSEASTPVSVHVKVRFFSEGREFNN